ncbi:MAG: DUF2147 domain-containing protein [Acetobacteraceae bacterium]|nr:DUF2147 domain-containing protein [Acetobacteraceae bacterium]
MVPRVGLASALVLAGAAALALGARADLSSPVGEWRTIDDNTHQPRAIVRIFERNGRLYGVVEKSLVPHPRHRTCDGCTDDRKGQPILGMEIIRGLERDGDQWDGGTILDPENGKVYRCKMMLRDGGRELAVRGFIGLALLGRTQIWERVG